MHVDEFITRWSASSGSEIANFQSFAHDLCELLGVERPKPAQSDGQTNDYRFERPVTETHTGKRRSRRIDLYRRGCFVMEAKQGAGPKAEAELAELQLPHFLSHARLPHFLSRGPSLARIVPLAMQPAGRAAVRQTDV